MAETASGSIALPVQYAANLVASSATFRTLTGAADATAAKAHIYFGETIDYTDDEDPEEIVCERPRALVYPDEGQDNERIGAGEWLQTNRVMLELELVIPAAYVINWNSDTTAEQKQKKKDANLWLWNKLGAIQDEMIVNSGSHDGSNPYLNVRQFTLSAGPIPPRTDSGETWGAARFTMSWV
jgi:hypothetical protein